MASEIRVNQIDGQCKNCRSRNYFGTDLLECLESSDCSWVVYFGYTRFCKKPYAFQTINSKIISAPQIAH